MIHPATLGTDCFEKVLNPAHYGKDNKGRFLFFDTLSLPGKSVLFVRKKIIWK